MSTPTGARLRYPSVSTFAPSAVSTLALVIGAAFNGSTMAAELPVHIGETITVTATRVPQKLQNTVQHTSVITRAQIEASTAQDLPTLLRQESGIEIAQSGGMGTQAAMRIRGADPDHVLVLIDGVRINSVSAGATAIEHLLPDEIERIEIVRGNVSSVYGSEAIGGVVQIFTQRGQGAMKVSGSVAAGTDNFQKLNVGISGAIGATQLRFGATRTRTDGFSSARDEFIPSLTFAPADIDDDGYRNTTFNFTLSHLITPNHELGLNVMQSRADVDYDGSFQNHSNEKLTSMSLFSENSITQSWQSRLQLSQGVDDLVSDLNGIKTDSFKTRNRQITWSNEIDAGAGTWRFGAESLSQRLDSSAAYSRNTRHVKSVFGGYSLVNGAHDAQINLRYDHYSDFGSASTGLIGYGYRITPSVRMTASYSTAFKAPTFNELYTQAFAPFYVGNPNLNPERARSAEIGLTYNGTLGFARATLFQTRTRDLIETAFDPLTFTSTPMNLDQGRNRGLEFSWTGKVAGFDARATYTVQNAENARTHVALLRRARQFGSLAFGQTFTAFDWRAEVLASGPHPDIHATTFTPVNVPGYGVLNLNLGWKPARDWKLSAKFMNLLDADYSLVHGYNTQGRSALIEIAYQPK